MLIFLENELNLRINPIKTGLKHRTEGTLFLGYKLFGDCLPQVLAGLDNRLLSNNIRFNIPVYKLLNRYKERGFLQISKKGSGSKNKMIPQKFVGRRQDK